MEEARNLVATTLEPRITGNVVALPRPAAANDQPLSGEELRRLRAMLEMMDKISTSCPAARRALFDL